MKNAEDEEEDEDEDEDKEPEQRYDWQYLESDMGSRG